MKVNSSLLGSKIISGIESTKVKKNYFMASLQINRTHFCCAGMFKPGFLISTGTCVEGIERELPNADVVIGHYDLDKGHRQVILGLEKHQYYNSTCRNRKPVNSDIGVIMVFRAKVFFPF